MTEWAILAYPWQHAEYDDNKLKTAPDQLAFCVARIAEARQKGLYSVAAAWETEAARLAPQLMSQYAETLDTLATYRALLARALTRIDDEDAASANGDESKLAAEIRAAVEGGEA